jgi:rRNA maturation RNase YbeY
MAGTVDITNFTKRRMPLPPFKRITEAALPGWDISISFVGATRARALNKKLRNKEYVPNVLSYEAGPKHGEIIICMDRVMKERMDYGIPSPIHFAQYLLIHGLMHLKGHPHGPTMDRSERALKARFNIISNEKTAHRNGHRSRNAPRKGSGSRGGTR